MYSIKGALTVTRMVSLDMVVQIAFLKIGLVTLAAGILFYICMYIHVFRQINFELESFLTHRTFERANIRMVITKMALQVGSCVECFGTAATLERFQSCVSPLVYVFVANLCEALATDFTTVRLLLRVYS